MFSVPDIMVVSVLALLLFGPDQLPKMMRQAGRLMREVQSTSQAFVAEMERAADVSDPIHETYRPPASTFPPDPLELPAPELHEFPALEHHEPPAGEHTEHAEHIEATVEHREEATVEHREPAVGPDHEPSEARQGPAPAP